MASRTCTLENLLPPSEVGTIEDHLPVEAPGPEQRGVEDLRPVRGGQDHDALLGVEAVELREQLIQGLLPLVVAAHDRADAARLAQGIQLVDEDDARGLLLGLGEEVAHARGPHADEHLHEVRAGQAEERHAGLSRDGLGQQRLSGAGRADDEHPFGDLPAEAPVALGILEEVHDLHQLAARLVDARDVVERHAGLVLDVHPGLVLADGHEPLLRAEAPHDENPDADEHERGTIQESRVESQVFSTCPANFTLACSSSATSPGSSTRAVTNGRAPPPERFSSSTLSFGSRRLESVGRQRAADRLLAEGEIRDLALLHERLELAVRHVRGAGRKERS